MKKRIDMAYAEKLGKLSGMVYAQGAYTAYEWLAKTGVSCGDFPGLIETDRNNKMIWTPLAEGIYLARKNQVKLNWAAIGIKVNA